MNQLPRVIYCGEIYDKHAEFCTGPECTNQNFNIIIPKTSNHYILRHSCDLQINWWLYCTACYGTEYLGCVLALKDLHRHTSGLVRVYV